MNVRLEQEWTDSEGAYHPAGAMVDVDLATLAQLQAAGIVSEQADPDGGGWVGPTGDDPDGENPDGGGWVGPTGGESTGSGGSGS